MQVNIEIAIHLYSVLKIKIYYADESLLPDGNVVGCVEPKSEVRCCIKILKVLVRSYLA